MGLSLAAVWGHQVDLLSPLSFQIRRPALPRLLGFLRLRQRRGANAREAWQRHFRPDLGPTGPHKRKELVAHAQNPM